MEKLKIFAQTIEDEAVQQVKKMNECAAYKDCYVRIMPDCHAGIGCTIGTVIAIKNRIVPNTVGVDIGCGMLVTELGQQNVDVKQLDRVINEKIPSGFNIHEEAKPFPMLDMLFSKEAVDKDIAERSIGTLGGGNHFIELDVDEHGKKYLVIHSGSRNLGKRVCEYWQKRAVEYCKKLAYDEQEIIDRLKAEGRQKEISTAIKEAKANAPKVDKDLAYIEGIEARQYLYDMWLCQFYADLNRMTMADIICSEMGLKIESQFTTRHNYIDTQHNILRKGAVSALNDERLLIPINMRDGSLIYRGRGNLDWLYSAPHGAGRLMSRKKAKETLAMTDFEQSMQGIYTTSVCAETIDEAPMVYKPMQEIIDCIQPTAEVLNIIKPLYNFKAKSL